MSNRGSSSRGWYTNIFHIKHQVIVRIKYWGILVANAGYIVTTFPVKAGSLLNVTTFRCLPSFPLLYTVKRHKMSPKCFKKNSFSCICSAKKDFIETIHVKHTLLIKTVHYLIVSFSSYGNFLHHTRNSFIEKICLPT